MARWRGSSFGSAGKRLIFQPVISGSCKWTVVRLLEAWQEVQVRLADFGKVASGLTL